jgi:hypothetical protein
MIYFPMMNNLMNNLIKSILFLNKKIGAGYLI